MFFVCTGIEFNTVFMQSELVTCHSVFRCGSEKRCYSIILKSSEYYFFIIISINNIIFHVQNSSSTYVWHLPGNVILAKTK